MLPLIDTRRLAQAIVQTAKDSTWTIAASTLLNIVDRFLPGTKSVAKTLAEQVQHEVASVAPAAMIDHMRGAIPQDLLVGFINILAALNEMDVPGTIIIDQTESASEVVREALLGLAVQVPDNWSVVLAVNDELPEGIAFFENVWPRLAYSQASQSVLEPLDVGALESWCLVERNTVPSLVELEAILSNCQGRPLLLREWVSGASTEAELGSIWQRLGPYYQRRLNALSIEARSLVRALALLPAQSRFPLSLISLLTESKSSRESFATVEELLNAQFLEESPEPDTYRFVHDVTKRQVLKSMPRAVIKELANIVLAALKALSSEPVNHQLLYTIAKLDYEAENYTEFLENALPAATNLLHSGSYEPARELYQACISLGSEQISASAEVEARLGMADVLYATGYYHEGLQLISEADSWTGTFRARGRLTQGRLLLRLSNFPAAQERLRSARLEYENLADLEGIIKCEKEEVTVLRDVGEYERALKKAVDIVAKAEASRVSIEVLCSCYRALARSRAFTGPLNRALEDAQSAISLAQDTNSPSNVSNAQLAMAEVYRLARQPSAAIEYYRTSAETALTLGNRDAYLWSILALSDCYFLLDNMSEAQNVLVPVGDVVRAIPSRYPLVHLHWQLSEFSILHVLGNDVAEDLQSVVTDYGRLGVRWPAQYAADLVAGRQIPAKSFG